MNHVFKITQESIAVLILTAVLFSCTNDTKEVRDFLAEKNLPIAVAKDAFHVYKDSGRITSKLMTPHLRDFSNRKKHPYKEFPEGIKIINFKNKGKDSITILGDYALTYSKTMISEIKGNVVVINHSDETRLETSQLFWDQKNEYFFSEKSFTLTTPSSIVKGVGFESKENLTKRIAKQVTGDIETDKSQL